MIKFKTPTTLDGKQLVEELRLSGVAIEDARNGTVVIDGNGELWLDIVEDDKTKAEEVVKKHIARPRPELSIEEKLESVGLKIDDLKAALGL